MLRIESRSCVGGFVTVEDRPHSSLPRRLASGVRGGSARPFESYREFRQRLRHCRLRRKFLSEVALASLLPTLSPRSYPQVLRGFMRSPGYRTEVTKSSIDFWRSCNVSSVSRHSSVSPSSLHLYISFHPHLHSALQDKFLQHPSKFFGSDRDDIGTATISSNQDQGQDYTKVTEDQRSKGRHQ